MAISLQLRFPNARHRPMREKIKEKSTKIDYNLLRAEMHPDSKKKFTRLITDLEKEYLKQSTNVLPDEILNQFQEFVVQSAKDIAEGEVKVRPDWFMSSKAKLLHHIKLRNKAFKEHLSKRIITMLNNLR